MKNPVQTPTPAPDRSGAADRNLHRLTMGEKLAYASGDVASCLYFAIFMNFLTYFYTDVYGLSAAAVGTMIFITRTWDWINDPIMGMIADRTRSRWGQFRPWILWMIVPYMVVGVLTFTTFDFGPAGKLAYAYITYTLLTMIYTAINIPYGALMGVMTASSEERTVLASFRFVGAALAVMFVSGTLLWFVRIFGQGDPQQGFTLSVALYALLAGGFFFVLFKKTRERVSPPATVQVPLKEDLKAVLKNGPWIVMIVVSILTIVTVAVRSGATVYYFKYVAGNELWAGTVLTIGGFVQLLAVLCTKQFVRFLGGKKRAYLLISSANVVLLALFYLIPPDSLELIVLHTVIATFVTAPLMPMFWAMIADTADYGSWKHGHRCTGLIFAAGTFSQKIGWSIGPALSMWLLSALGFVANVEQSPETVHGLRLLMSVIPAGFGVLAVLALFFYKIDARVEAEMRASLDVRP